jgi:stringent starvation protein B
LIAVPTTQTPFAAGSSTRPYLIRAIYEWCTDNGFTPYVAVFVDKNVTVPMEYVKDNEIVLNISLEATNSLKIGNDFIEFKARFGGVLREIMIRIDNLIAIYARENGQGMAFPLVAGNNAAEDSADNKDDSATVSLSSVDSETPIGLKLTSVSAEATHTTAGGASSDEETEPPPTPPPVRRPSLTRVK